MINPLATSGIVKGTLTLTGVALAGLQISADAVSGSVSAADIMIGLQALILGVLWWQGRQISALNAHRDHAATKLFVEEQLKETRAALRSEMGERIQETLEE